MATKTLSELEDMRHAITVKIGGLKAQHEEELRPYVLGLTQLENLILTLYKGETNTKAIVEWYIKLRDEKSDNKKRATASEAHLTAIMDSIELYLLTQLNAAKSKSMSTDAGIVFKQPTISVTVENKDEFIKWIREDLDQRLDFADVRAAKTNIVANKDAREAEIDAARAKGETLDLPLLPPGIKWSSQDGVNVRRNA
jgi:hypothetical protein